MDKINLISDIIKTSMKFDDALKNNNFFELKKLSDDVNTKFKLYKSLKSNEFDKEIEGLLSKINQVNIYAVDYVNKINKNSTKYDKRGHNTLILFYSDTCQASINFMNEWEELKKKLVGRVNTIAINCKTDKYRDICNFFNVSEYPSIRYTTPTKIHEYYGEMNHDEIMNTFHLN